MAKDHERARVQVSSVKTLLSLRNNVMEDYGIETRSQSAKYTEHRLKCSKAAQ